VCAHAPHTQVFALFDTDGSGAIGTDELGEAMKSMGMNATQRELEILIREVRSVARPRPTAQRLVD
jgi:Ca2+-binding EF-hand superfamily protein